MKIETDENGHIILKEIYSGVVLETKEGKQLRICMRDYGFDIRIDDSKWIHIDKDINDVINDSAKDLAVIFASEVAYRFKNSLEPTKEVNIPSEFFKFMKVEYDKWFNNKFKVKTEKSISEVGIDKEPITFSITDEINYDSERQPISITDEIGQFRKTSNFPRHRTDEEQEKFELQVKIKYAISYMQINNCDRSNEGAIKSLEYLQELHEYIGRNTK